MGASSGMDENSRRDPIIAFVHIQKTAGTTAKFILRNSFGLGHSDVNPVDPSPDKPFDTDDLDFALTVVPGLRSISGHQIIEPTRYLANRVMPYTMLRDPVRRTISHFQDRQVTERQVQSIDAYLDEPENHDFQVRRIAGEADLEKAKSLLRDAYFFVGLTERFDLSLRVFQARCPYPIDLRCRLKNVAGNRDIATRLASDAGTVDRIRAANLLDAALYAYVENELLPAQIAATGIVSETSLPAYPRWRLPVRFHVSRAHHRLVYRRRLKRERRRRGFH